MTDLGKSTYEGEKDIAVQKDLYAAVMEALTEIIRSLNPNYSSNIDIQKGQGLTVERKSKNLTVSDVLEVQKKPEPIPTEQPKEPAIKTLYGGGVNNLTPDDIKAIAAIMGAQKGHTVVGGEGLIIKYNGQPLFETDEKGKIMIHTAVSPEIKAKLSALHAGQPNPTPVPPTRQDVSPIATPSQMSNLVGNAFANLVNSLPVVGVPTNQPNVENNPEVAKPSAVTLPPDFSTGREQGIDRDDPSQEPLRENPEVVAAVTFEENKPDLPQSAQPNVATSHQAETAESISWGRSIINTASDYIVERAKKDSQVTAEAVGQVFSNLAASIVANMNAQGLPIITNAISGQYRGVMSRLTTNTEPERDKKLDNYMDSVVDMFNELQQDDPNIGISASNAIMADPEPQPQVVQKPVKIPASSIEDALLFMSARDDGAKAQDGKGYNADDTGIGKRLATQINQGEPLDKVQAKEALEMLKKYKRQLSEGEIRLPTWKSVQGQYLEPTQTPAKIEAKPEVSQEVAPTSKPALNIPPPPANLSPVQRGEYYKNAVKENLGDRPSVSQETSFVPMELPAGFTTENSVPQAEIATPPAVDQQAIFAKQQEILNNTESIKQQKSILKAAFDVYTQNKPAENNATIKSGRNELELPTGAKFVNQIDDRGINYLSLERDGASILLGRVALPGTYTPANNIMAGLTELRQLRVYLSEDYKINPEPVNSVSIQAPEAVQLTTPNPKPPTIKVEIEAPTIKVETEPMTIEVEKAPAISRGGR
jgi:hypothetical protein